MEFLVTFLLTARVPKDHLIKQMVNQALNDLWRDFEAIYAMGFPCQKTIWRRKRLTPSKVKIAEKALQNHVFTAAAKVAA